jgi:hypothetical protein
VTHKHTHTHQTLETFQKIDVDGNMQLDKEEFGQAFALMGLKLAPNDRDELFKEFDVNGSGTVDLDEFRQMVKTYLGHPSVENIARVKSAPTPGAGSGVSGSPGGFIRRLSIGTEPPLEDRTARLRAMVAADKASSHDQDMKLKTLRAGATQVKEIFNKGLGVVDLKAAPSAEAAAASSSSPIKLMTRVSSSPGKETKATFEEKVGKIAGARGSLSPRSQRLLGGLSGATYKNIKADYIPSERAKIEAAARCRF